MFSFHFFYKNKKSICPENIGIALYDIYDVTAVGNEKANIKETYKSHASAYYFMAWYVLVDKM